MKWAHLPVAGGIYDQDPRLLARWLYIFGKRSEHEEKERQKQDRESKNTRRGGGKRGRVAGH